MFLMGTAMPMLNMSFKNLGRSLGTTRIRPRASMTIPEISDKKLSLPPAYSVIPQTPLKVMLFIDGTWLFYTLIQGRSSGCPVKEKFGRTWSSTHRVDWDKFIQVIQTNIVTQLHKHQNSYRVVDLIRTYVFTSTRADTPIESDRARMITDFQNMNFEVHRLLTKGTQEKCVDIALAVEMLYMATIPDGYDIAVILTGDKDFIPAMQKTRLKGKRVALCSMRNSCNLDLCKSDQHIRDFDVIWLDDYIDDYIIPRDQDAVASDVSDARIVE
eukprot:gene4803-9578_t